MTTRRLLVLTLLGPVDPNPALADDWQVVRSEFDPRLIGELKEQVRRNPDDAGLLRRLCGLYRKHSSIDKLGAEVLAVAQKSGQASDLYLTALIARERGQLDEASKLLEQAVQRGGLEEAKVALLLADLAQKKTPADVATARKQLDRALGLLKPGDGRRKSVLRKQIDLALQAQDQPDAEQKLRALIDASQGVESQRLRQELAELLARGGKNKEALAEWQELATKLGGESKAQALLRIGELQELLRDDLAAMATYRQSQKLLSAGHHLRRDVSEHLIALSRKRDELPQFIQQFEAEHPAGQRGFGEWELLGRLYDERGDTKAALAAYRGALRSDPHSIDVRRRLIAILERGGVTPEVLSEYEQLIVQAPGDSRGYLELAERQWKVGQKQRALGTLRRAAARFSADPSLHSALAELYSRWGEADLALQESELLVRLDPREESYIVNLGELYWARGKKDRAEEIWKRLLTMGGSRAQGQARLADIYAEHSMMPQALDLYQKAVTAEPNNLQLRRGLAQAYERLSRNRDAVAMWEQIYFAAKGPAERLVQLEARKRLGSLLSKETRLQATLYTWQRRLAAALNQSNQTLLPETLLLGLLVAEVEQQLGKPGEAEQVLSRLRVRLPDGPQLAEVLLSLAQVLRAQRKLEEAIAVLKQAATLLPERQRELYAQLAELSMQSYRDGDAIRYAEQAVADASGELALGEILERRDEVQRAMAAYQRAMERDPRLFRAHMALARLHVQRGELTEAAALYREVVRRTPQEELVLEAGRKAIDLHEFLGSLGELLKELSPLAYSVVPKPVYRRLLLLAYERYAAPLAALSKSGDASAQAELQRLGQGGLKPLTESLTDGDGQEQRVAVALLGELRNPSAVPSLLNVAMAGLPLPGQESRTVLSAANLTGGSVRPSVDMDLRVDALLAVAKLTDPQSISSLLRLAKSREKQLRLAAYYGLFLLADKLDREKLGQVEAGLLDTTPAGRALVALVLGRASELQHQPLSPKVRGLFLSTLEKRRLRSDEADELFTMAVVQALGRSRDKTVVPPLMELLRLGNDEIERHAAWALGRLQDARAVAPLLRAVFGKSSSVRTAAVSALGQLGRPVEPSASGSVSGSASERLPSDRRGLDGLDVARLLSDLVSEPSPMSAQPAWLDSPGDVAAALRDGLEESPDLALRTLEDLLHEDVTSRRGPLRLYPLSLAVPHGSLPPSLAVSVLPTILPSLRKLALPGSGDVSLAHVQLAAVRVLGQVALSDVAESGRAAAILKDVIELGTGSQVLLLAASLYAQLPTTLRDGQPVFDRLLAHPERWVRLQALRLAAEPNARSLLSAAMRIKASQDSDGFIREAAERIK